MAVWKQKRQYTKAHTRFSRRIADGYTKESCQAALDAELAAGCYIRPSLVLNAPKDAPEDTTKYVENADPTELDTSTHIEPSVVEG